MNILYVTDSDITINKGGVNRITHFLSRQFMAIPGWHCYLAYMNESTVLPVSEFHGKLHISRDNTFQQLKDYILQHQISIVILNLTLKKNIYFTLPVLRAVQSKISSFSILFCYHTYPGNELFGIPFSVGIRRLLHLSSPWKTCRETGIQILNKTPFRIVLKKKLRKKYSFIHEHCDQLILLSARYIPLYADLAGCRENHHLISIPNPLIMPQIYPVNKLSEKQKKVLIVSRLEECPKRISLALKIWKQIEKEGRFSDWQLLIVGKGEDENHYKKMAHQLRLKQVSFEGWKFPLEYYRQSSILMITSRYEGFSLTITEAQQMGVIPFAFDAFEVVHDLIQSGKNGIIIPEKNIHLYATRLMQFMSDPGIRVKTAAQAIEDCQQYSMDNVILQWNELFNSFHKQP